MNRFGAHVSIAGGVGNAPANAAAIGADAFALFTKNQRQWSAPPLDAASIAEFRERCAASGFAPEYVLPHDSYLINLGNPDPGKRRAAVEAFTAELERCAALGLVKLNFHPGSHLGKCTVEEALTNISVGVRAALDAVPGVMAVIENTAGQGSCVGGPFAELGTLMEKIDRPGRVGVCFDTCHAYAAGYDLATPEGYEKTMAEFAAAVGFEHLAGMHLNDAQGVCGGHLDRHAPIGDGALGVETFRRIVNDPRIDNVPLILETPEPDRWAAEIRLLRSLAEG